MINTGGRFCVLTKVPRAFFTIGSRAVLHKRRVVVDEWTQESVPHEYLDMLMRVENEEPKELPKAACLRQ